MALYSIESEQCIGMSHSGTVTINGESTIELSDEEVDILVSLIQEKQSTNVDNLGLETLHPDIFHKLDDAYGDLAYKAEEMHWLWESYYGVYFEYDTDELMDYCEKHCGFEFKPEEHFHEDDLESYKEDPESYEDEIADLKSEAFDEWLRQYVRSLSDDEVRSFFYNHMNVNLDLDSVPYAVKIPAAIIKKAQT